MIIDTLWCGSQASFDAVLAAQEKATAFMAAKEKDVTLDDLLPPLYKREGSVGVVNIHGPLVSGDAGFMQLFGVTGYDNVREALVKAVADKDAKSIMLSIDSPGGAVNGVTDAARFIQAVGRIKPMSAYADTMASAAYWLGSGAAHITASDTGMIGSIGVLSVHREASKMHEKEGITTTVMRAGEFKALANPYEPLSDTAKETTQARLEYAYGLFADTVAENRGTTRAALDAKAGRGREFMGAQALDAGLVDKIGTYEQALAYAASQTSANRGASVTKPVAHASISDNNVATEAQGPDVKPTLTPEQLAAIEAGITASAEPETETEAESAAEPAVAALAAATEKVTALEAQLSEATTALEASKQAAIDAGETTKAFAAIVSASTKGMLVALGSSTADLDALSATALLAKHAETSATFKAKFKAGGVAATSATTEESAKPAKTAAVLNPLFAARVQLVTNAK